MTTFLRVRFCLRAWDLLCPAVGNHIENNQIGKERFPRWRAWQSLFVRYPAEVGFGEVVVIDTERVAKSESTYVYGQCGAEDMYRADTMDDEVVMVIE